MTAIRKLVGGFGLLSLSLFMLLGYFRADITGGPAVEVLTFLLAVVLPAAGGAGLLYSHHRQSEAVERRRHRRQLEGVKSDLVGLARKRGGKLTVVEAMSELRLEAQLAEEALKELHASGMAELELTDSGLIVYAFEEVRLLGEKKTARGILDG